MNYTDYGGDRVRIVYGGRAGAPGQALESLYGLVAQYVPYVLVASHADEVDAPSLDENLILLGARGENRWLENLFERLHLAFETRAEGYSIRVLESPWAKGRFVALLQGADTAGALYAVSDFEKWYVKDVLQYEGYHYNQRYRPFVDPLLPFERVSAPRIEHRGLWSWGHVVYDYRGYIEQMRRMKLNTLILWNDFAPVNAAEAVAFAHQNAVKVIWGFSWCWGEAVNPDSEEDLRKWTAQVLAAYEAQYRDTGADGIYFQIFTETGDTSIGEKSIAELAVNWVNRIGAEVYAKYPDLWIQFGVHATSIRGSLGDFARIDPRMSLVWEDAGGFPYQYDPQKIENIDETDAYTGALLRIRGARERFGAVFKGFTVLNWTRFEHPRGPFVMGAHDAAFCEARRRDKAFTWRYAAPCWIAQLEPLARVLRRVAEADVADRLITVLAEDGMLECGTHVSLALLSELLWNPETPKDALLRATFHAGYEL